MAQPDVRAAADLRRFLEEDLGRGDVTSRAIVPETARASGVFLAKSGTVVCGLDLAGMLLRILDADVAWEESVAEGQPVVPGRALASAAGNARALLAGERVALNLLQRMCGIAWSTRRYVDAVAGTSCRILDTRKTAPGLRCFDKRAVAAGGGKNHRFGLDDGVLIKDNHLRIAGGVRRAIESARAAAPATLKIEVEVESEPELRAAVEGGADIVLIDNQPPETLARWVRLAGELAPGVCLEASGGITLSNVRAYAETGVDFVSVGALTHSVAAADISLEIEPA